MQVGSWWTVDGRDEVDVAAFDGAGGLLVGACTWGLDARAAARVVPVLFTAGRLDARAAARVARGETVHVPVEALFETPPER